LKGYAAKLERDAFALEQQATEIKRTDGHSNDP
jgi:hypothetical protein